MADFGRFVCKSCVADFGRLANETGCEFVNGNAGKEEKFIRRRMVLFKRPAVMFAIAFAGGIALEEKGIFPLVAFTAAIIAGQIIYLRKLFRERQRISVSDRLLFLAPFFLICGFACMHLARAGYGGRAENYARCLDAGKDVAVSGTAKNFSITKNGYSFELHGARATIYGDGAEVATSGDGVGATSFGKTESVAGSESGVDAAFSKDGAEVAVFGDGGRIEKDVGTLLVYYDCPAEVALSVKEGQKVFVYGRGYSYREAENPGQFDAKSYYFSKKITGAVNARRIDVTDSSYNCLNQALFLAKKRILQSFSDYLGAGAGVVSSMLLGERAFLSEETKDLYRKGGISHILAISGLHVSLFGAAVYSLLRKSILGRNGAIPVACFCVLVYGRFVNAGTSTGRAIIMFLLMLLATVLGRTYDTLSAMSVSMMLLLVKSPGALFTAAFQLSYAAAYGASVFAGVLGEGSLPGNGKVSKDGMGRGEYGTGRGELLNVFSRAAWSGFLEALRFGLAITLITLPLVAVHFFEVPLYGILLNPVVVPLLSVLLFCALLSGGLGIVFPVAGIFFSGAVRAVLWLYELLCRVASELPFSMLLFGKPRLWQVALYYLLLCVGVLLWKREQVRRRELFLRTGEVAGARFRGYYLLVFLLPFCLLPVPQTGLVVSFLSVGQGDGIVLESRSGIASERKVVLVDGGSSDVSKLGEQRLIPFLKSRGIRRIACAFVSHTDEDHVSGLKELLMQMPEGKRNAVSGAEKGLAGENAETAAEKGSLVVESAETEGLSGQSAGKTGGLRKILSVPSDEIVVERLVLPELAAPDAEYLSLLELAREKGVEVVFLTAGDALEVGGDLQFFCLSPEKEGSYADKNSASMVLLAEYGEFDLLLPGDTTKEAEATIVRRWKETPELRNRTIEVLKVAHHGSTTSTSEAFLATLRPQAAVISCGRGNRYGHPHKEILERLENMGVAVFRTDVSGAVTVRVKGEKVSVEGYLK